MRPLSLIFALLLLGVPAQAADPKPFPGKATRWEGFARYDFEVAGTPVTVVAPDKPLSGRPWAWRGEFFGAFPNADVALVKAGWHIAYASTPDLFGSPKAIARWEKVYDALVKDHGLSPKPGLIGLSRGGLYCLAWAEAHPDKTLAVYLDNGVCDFKSWPGGKPKGFGASPGSEEEWQKLLKAYDFKDDKAVVASKANPIDNLAPSAKARVPLLLVYGDVDHVVPAKENSEIVYDRYKELGGPVERIVKKGNDHHPHGLTDPQPIVTFFERARGTSTFVYVSLATEKRIVVYQMDAETGKLTEKGSVKCEGEPGALVVDPGKQYLFAALRAEGKLSSFRIDHADGGLTHVNTVDAGADPAQISTDATGRFLLTAYYVAAKVTVHEVGQGGALGAKQLQSIATADKAHAIVPDRTNRFVFVPHTGSEAIFQFTLDSKTGKLAANSPAKLETPKGTGPRHLVFHPSQPLAYVSNEQGGSVTAYALDEKTGTLKSLQTVSTLPEGFKGENACAEIRLHPSGKFLYAANRGHDSIACFALDDAGKMAALGQEPTEKTPRSFDVEPSGRYLFAAGEGSGKLATYQVDAKTGKLKTLGTSAVGKTPWWVLAVELPGK